jgi:penicillin-binding protein 2
MVIAVIVGILVFVGLVAALVAVLVLRSRHDEQAGTRVGTQSAHSKTISTVGVSAKGGGARVTSSESTSGKTSENVHSRFVAMGVLAAGVFGSLAVRLFDMQVLESQSYRTAADQNAYTTVYTPAPRGYIYDADGIAIVKNRSALTVLADADVIDNHDVMMRLSAVLGIPYNIIRQRVQDTSLGAQSQRIISSDARLRDVAFIQEHSDAFSGISVEQRATRTYPYGALAAHVVGYTGSVSETELANIPSNRNVELGDIVGKSGLESQYDNLLAGEHGERKVVADSSGAVVSIESETLPTRGSDIYLTIKAPVQYVAESALAELIAPNGVIGTGTGVAGAVVAMDVTDGSILTMASYPTYSPATFTGGISQDTWDLYSTASSYYPLLNRAIQGTYPAASTYKAFTGMAGLKYGFADTSRTWTCTGSWDGFGSGDVQKCWKEGGHGTIGFREAIVQSCDTVFYEIAKSFFYAGTSQGGTISDTALQEEIAKFGFGQQTGVDLTGEEAGRIPTPAWKAQYWADVPTEAVWRGGDMTNLVIGQGDVLVTPLQMAVAYGGIATGNLMKPHLLKEVRNANSPDKTAVSVSGEVVATPDVSADNLATVRDALHGVGSASSTITAAFTAQGLDVDDLACKTGTGEVSGKDDYAWFACYMPYDDPKYVVVVMIEQGGGGAAVASPVAAKVMGALFQNASGQLTDVGSVAGSNGQSVAYSGSSSSRSD